MANDARPARRTTFRRHLLALMRRERGLGRHLAAARAAGVDLQHHFAGAECSALRWAIAELAGLYPEAAASARGDLERDEARRAVRALAAAAGAPGEPPGENAP